MALIDEMRSLREDIESGKQIRRRRVKEIKKDLAGLMKGASRKRKENFKALKVEVKAIRRANQTQHQELKKELAAALAAFWGKKGEE